MKRILITGGAGFAGSNIAIALKHHHPGTETVAFDNLYRKGSEKNLARLATAGVEFIKGDVRFPTDLEKAGDADFLVECSAEPSVLAGSDGDTGYLVDTNLNGAVNCAEYCRKRNAGMLFLSTSRVYPIRPLAEALRRETDTRFELEDKQNVKGISARGVSEEFPVPGNRSLYGATKYSAEIMLEEYRVLFDIPVIINRCGVIAGPWQFGKADQGIAAFWTAAHMCRNPLKYIGFGGTGKQVRDFLHIDDLIRLIIIQTDSPENFSGNVFNVGGGLYSSASLKELTGICSEVTGETMAVGSEPATRYADIPVYITDHSKLTAFCGWKPEKDVTTIIRDIYQWLKGHPEILAMYK
jgi:CDP-paratose 2-epimerase